MRHFDFLTDDERSNLFHRNPVEFNKNSSRQFLGASLGATLYTPGIRPNLLKDVMKTRQRDGSSTVICLEDSIPDEKVEEAEENLHNFLVELDKRGTVDDLPLLFVRPRSPEHLMKIYSQNRGLLHSLTGFVFPKFEDVNGRAQSFAYGLQEINREENLSLYYMPVLETASILFRETRESSLNSIAQVLASTNESILVVRIGATDMASHYALRRSSDFTIYDVHVLASVIADIVNILGRAEKENYISGAVWEHFSPTDRTFKPQLRESLFSSDKKLRRDLLTKGYDSFIREIQLDKINGITGKTIIHPSHINIVHSLMVVSHEEYSDASTILADANQGGGAYSSIYRNKMNEVKPHLAWAKQINRQAEAFGVANPGVDFVDFLEKFEEKF